MSNTVRMTTAKVDQGGNKSNNVCSLPSRTSKISDKISQKKKSSHRNLLRTLMYKRNRRHKFTTTCGFLIQIYVDLRKILQNWWNHSIHWPTIYKIWKFQAQKWSYAPPRATGNISIHRLRLTRRHAPLNPLVTSLMTSSSTNLQLYDVTDDVTPTNRFDWPGNQTRSEPPKKNLNKKREKEKALT